MRTNFVWQRANFVWQIATSGGHSLLTCGPTRPLLARRHTDGTVPNNHPMSVMATYRRKPPVTTIKADTAVITQK